MGVGFKHIMNDYVGVAPAVSSPRCFRADLDSKVGILYNLPAQPCRGEDFDYIAEVDVQEQLEAVQGALGRLDLGYKSFPIKDDVSGLLRALKSYEPDVVVNISEGAFGDSSQEMNVAGLLELLRIPYTGSPPLTIGLCQNKGLAKDVLSSNGIPTPRYQVLSCFKDWRGEIGYPLFVKPLREDASLGISRRSFVKSDDELRSQVEYVNSCYMQPALVEEYIDGREFTVSIVGNEDLEFLPVSEIVFEIPDGPRIRDYSAKWIKQSNKYKKTKMVCPAKLDPSLLDDIKIVASKAYRILQCRDYARVDIRLKECVPYVLEVNPNPDISPEGSLPYSLKAGGVPFEEFVKRILCFALGRGCPQG